MSPDRPVDADGFSRPHVSARLPPPAALYCHRAHRSCARRYHPAPGSRPRRVARGAGDGAPGRSTPAARPPYHSSMCSQARPTCTAHPNPPGDDETKTVVPSRRHPQSIDAAARHRFSPASPGPTGDAYDRPGTFWARPLCPGAPYPWSILLADTAGVDQGVPLAGDIAQGDGYLAVIDFAQTATPLTATPTHSRPTWETQKDRTPTPHRFVPSAS